MARATPAEAFEEAVAAMRRGDWTALFACIDPPNVVTIATNGVNRFLAGGPQASATLASICAAHGVPADRAGALQSLGARITESARVSIEQMRADPASMMEQSRRHQKLVAEYREGVKALVASAADVAAFTGAIETALRAESGGGSVSTRLFVDETLEGVTVSGNRARGVRRMASGATEDVSFVRKKGAWFIRPFARI
jgi:uncharacterized protein YigA (DUF484 family)